MGQMKKIARVATLIIAITLVSIIGASSVRADSCPSGGEHEYNITITRKATEDATGLRRYVCTKCGYAFDEAIPTTGHVWSQWVIEIEATATTEGRRYRVCTKHPDTPHYEVETIPALGTTDETVDIAPSQTEPEETTIIATSPDGDDSGDSGSSGSGSRQTSISTEDASTESTEESTSSGQQQTIILGDGGTGGGTGGGITFLDGFVESFIEGFSGNINIIDVVTVTTTGGLAFWYLIVLVPLAQMVAWAKRKKKEARERFEEM